MDPSTNNLDGGSDNYEGLPDAEKARVQIRQMMGDPRLEPVQKEFGRIPIYGIQRLPSSLMIISLL